MLDTHERLEDILLDASQTYVRQAVALRHPKVCRELVKNHWHFHWQIDLFCTSRLRLSGICMYTRWGLTSSDAAAAVNGREAYDAFAKLIGSNYEGHGGNNCSHDDLPAQLCLRGLVRRGPCQLLLHNRLA